MVVSITGLFTASHVATSFLSTNIDPGEGTEEVKVILKPKARGEYTFRPRILFLDERGRYKTREPEPVEVSVKELGLSGWVKGR